jgi:flagellar basal body rod protein FlgC
VSGPTEFDILGAAAAGLDAERSALDVAARNVAAAEAAPDSHVFERLVPRFALAPEGAQGEGDGYEPPDDLPDDAGEAGTGTDDPPIRYLGTQAQSGVDVDAITEMVAVLDAQRGYEADASIFDLGKRLAERTIDLGRAS